jgi:hypothetical protein
MFGVFLHLAPAGEQEQFRMVSAPAGLQLLSGFGDPAQGVAASGYRDRNARTEEREYFRHHVPVVPAQHRIGGCHLTDPRAGGSRSSQAHV